MHRFPPDPRRTDMLVSGGLLAALVTVAGWIARGGLPLMSLPTLNAAESWSLQTVTAVGLAAWYAATIAGRRGRGRGAANDNYPAGYGGFAPPISAD